MSVTTLLASSQTEPSPPSAVTPAILQLAFRPLFLLGALFSIVSLGLWAAMWSGVIAPVVYGGPLWWHMHEMLFGFVGAIVAGFLLTAVQNWTGIPGIKGARLSGLVLVWLAARIMLYFSAYFPWWFVALVDLAFLPLVALALGASVARVRQWRNFVFVPVLLAMAVVNTVMHWAAHTSAQGVQNEAGTVMVLLISLLMSTMAGRVIPMFTANGTGTARTPDLPWLERASLATMLAAVLAGSSARQLPPALVATCMVLAAATLTLRGLRWRIWLTWRKPLLWSLHLGYWCVPLGLLLFGLSPFTDRVSHSQAMHTLTVGAMGMMILAMISRVSLGHTARPLAVGRAMIVAFAVAFAAFAVRVFGHYWIDNYAHVVVAAVLLWVVAYGCFAVVYFPVLTRPRLDGRPG